MTAYVRRQIVVQGDGVLAVVGIFKALVGLIAALSVGAWLPAWMCGVFVAGALLLIRGLYWPTLLALIGAAYADWPVREAWGLELSSYPLMAVQALVAVPLWLAAMDYPERLQGRARSAAWACCGAALLAGLAAPWLERGAYWLVVAPLALAAVAVLLVRMRRYRVPFGTRGWVCCLAVVPAVVVVCSEMFLPSSYPSLERSALPVNLWLSLGPLVLIALNIGRPRHDRKIVGADPRLGRRARGVLGKPGQDRGRGAGLVRGVLLAVREALLRTSALLRVGRGRRGAEAALHGRVPVPIAAFRPRGDGGRHGRGAESDGGDDGGHDSLRPAAAKVARELDDTGRLIPQERAG